MITLRRALPEDEEAVFMLARDLATSFQVERAAFSRTYLRALASNDTCLIVARDPEAVIGYVLGMAHATFYANGDVAWVEEIMVKPDFRKKGVGKSLMKEFEVWAASRECRLVALATRRASDFYQAIGYAESATYFKKVLAT
jgi:GNAT superfamily N-acetyltransferase